MSYVNYNQNLLGNKVAGVNDGFAVDGSFLFKGYTNETFQITNLLSNDSEAGNLSFECLKDLTHSNTSFNLVFGDNTTVIEMNTEESGYHLLSYMPYNNITGKRGNITYILVYIVNNCATLPTDCNLVFNGDFEQFSQLPDNIAQIERACNWESFRASPDYFNRNALHPPGSFSVDIPNNAFGSQNVLTPPGGNGYAGLSISRFATNSFFYESFGTRLVTPLQDNTEYQLTFNVSRADNYPGVTRMQAYIGNNLTYTSQNSIAIESNGILLTNPTFNSTATGWDTLTFTFTTGNTAGQTHLYLGGFNGVFYQGAAVVQQTYYYIDNVRLTPPTEVFNPTFDLVENILASNSAPINLSQLYANNSIDTFSGTGVELIGNEYFFNPNLAGIGSHVITINTFSPLGCVSTILSDTIEVISCQPPYISQVYAGAGKSKALEVKNASNTQAIAPGSYYLVYYEGNGVPANLAMPTASIDLATGGDILANGVKVFRTAAFSTPNYVTTLPNNQIFNFNGYDGIYDVIIISTSNGANAYNDRIDVLGDNTANNILFKDYTQEQYRSLVRMSCTPMGFPRIDYDEQDWVGFNRYGISTTGTYDDSFEIAQGTLTNGELGRHFSDELRWDFSRLE